MHTSRRVGLPVLTVLVGLLVLGLVAGCGSSSTSGSSGSSAPSASSPSSAATVDINAIQADPALKPLLPAGMTQIRVASDIPYPPWEYYDPPTSKNAAGFDYDLSQAIAKKIGVPAAFVETPFDSIILSVKGGKNDMIMSDMYDNAERESQGISFVDYAYDGTSILVKKGNPSGITDLGSLAGQTVASLSGGTQEALLRKLNAQFASEGKPQMTILAPQGQPACLLAVSSGRAVADLTDHSTAEYIAKTTNNGNTFEVVSDPAAPKGYEPQIVGIGILATRTGLIQAVQKALQDLIDDGDYAKIIDKYGLLPVDSAQVNQGSLPASSPSP